MSNVTTRTIADWLDWPEATLTAVGVRAADSQNRYTMFKKLGMGAAVNVPSGKFYPVFDWNKEKLLSEIARAGVKLPVNYRVFGKTFDGPDFAAKIGKAVAPVEVRYNISDKLDRRLNEMARGLDELSGLSAPDQSTQRE